jgi:hypothetical protein
MSVDYYQKAIACADTIATDCDFRTLSAAYSQMGEQYCKQLLFSYAIEAHEKSAYFASLINKHHIVAYEMEMVASAFILMGEIDKAEIARKEAIRLYHLCGKDQKAVESSRGLLHIYVENPEKLSDAKRIIDEFDAFFSLNDGKHELSPNKRQYYYYKGSYYEGIGLLDSAEYYYRKVERPNMSYVSLDPMYRGLLSVFKKRHQPDSIAKYAQLYCMANDSSIAVKDQELTAQLAASYQYNTFQQEAREKEREADSAKMGILILLFVILCIIFASFLVIQYYKKKKAEEKAQYERAKEEYERNIKALTQLEQSHKKVIQCIQDELEKATSDNVKYQQKNQLISKLNKEYEENKLQLTQENDFLRKRVEELRRRNDVTVDLEKSQRFFETEIAHRVKELSSKPLLKLTNEERDELLAAVGEYFPDLLHDLNHTSGVTPLGMYVCILAAMQVRTNDIANMLGISGTQGSNLKQDLSRALFNNNSARNLYSSIKSKYGLYLCRS